MQRTTVQKRIAQDLEQLSARNESLRTILTAFEPVLLTQEHMRHALVVAGLTAMEPDPEAFTRGVPMMVDKEYGDYADAFLAVSCKLFPVMARAFPAISGELGDILHNMEAGLLNPALLMEACISGDATSFRRQARQRSLKARILDLSTGFVLRPILQACGREVSPKLGGFGWQRGYCPVCGGMPHVAMLKKSGDDDAFLKSHGGQRWLSCSRCAIQWRYKRHACPHCGNEEDGTLEYFQPRGDSTERADLCKACGHYLVTLDVRDRSCEPEPDVAALELIPLDAVMQKKGYSPMADTGWNQMT